MANNRKSTLGRKEVVQTIWSTPRRVVKEKYLTPKGMQLKNQLDREGLSPKSKEYKLRIAQINVKYLKNRYEINPHAYPVKTIIHLK